MVSDSSEALARLRARLESRAARIWLDDARLERTADGRTVLHVAGPFQKRWFDHRCHDALVDVFGPAVEVDCPEPKAPRSASRRRAVEAPRLDGPAGAFALRAVQGFLDGKFPHAHLMVVHGPSGCGKTALFEWAGRLGGSRVFRLDLERLRRGASRGLVPRKPIVIADGVEQLGGRGGAQRTLCTILDAVQTRAHHTLVTIEEHPAQRDDLVPALANRLLGGILVPLGPAAAPAREPAGPLPYDALKEASARLYGVDRAALEDGSKKRMVVAARRTAMVAAFRAGAPEREIAAAFRLKSTRAVRDACRWAEREEHRDETYSGVLADVARVLASP